jgi:hypothetical protein
MLINASDCRLMKTLRFAEPSVPKVFSLPRHELELALHACFVGSMSIATLGETP